jgi:hypothetical protein
MHEKVSEFSATDIANFLACHRLLTLDRAEEAEEIERPFSHDPGVALLWELGLRHEQTYLRYLTHTQGLRVVHIPGSARGQGPRNPAAVFYSELLAKIQGVQPEWMRASRLVTCINKSRPDPVGEWLITIGG